MEKRDLVIGVRMEGGSASVEFCHTLPKLMEYISRDMRRSIGGGWHSVLPTDR